MAFEQKGTFIVNGIDYSNGGGSGGSGGTEIEYGTQAEFDAVKDSLPVGSAYFVTDAVGGSYEVYDDTERVIGSWYGKPLYQKVLYFPNRYSTSTDLPINVSDTDLLYIDNAWGLNQSDNVIIMPYAHPTDIGYNVSFLCRPKAQSPRNIQLRLGNKYSTSEYIYNVYCVIRYTKVGD